MSRPQRLIVYALTVGGLAALFAVFIGFKKDTALVGALEAAGAVSATGFAALAALGSMRAAAESSATARRSRAALARTMRPRIHPGVSREDGRVQCGAGRGAIDVTVVWLLTDRDPATAQAARLEPWRPDLPPGSDLALAVDLELPETATVQDGIRMVWIEYWDDTRVGHWRDTWQVGTEPPDRGTFLLTDSRLAH
ncbi:MAG TPA: hypothetical protein VGX25_03220 [Actinophytocola sp.]|uniref:hypothetical protein n=1 Tax=Actinophytocola sp. TaxID=1872138 RepID=UPI002DDD13AB|nr:hypothetical protein [Actinophytocola sp.]HEV2778389.1 hypothetical protein [Actinophytocola sp.]